jgi:hypothetical protein
VSDTLSSAAPELLEGLFERAIVLPVAEQSAFVAAECGSNAALRTELARLLEARAGEDHLAAAPRPRAPGRGSRATSCSNASAKAVWARSTRPISSNPCAGAWR